VFHLTGHRLRFHSPRAASQRNGRGARRRLLAGLAAPANGEAFPFIKAISAKQAAGDWAPGGPEEGFFSLFGGCHGFAAGFDRAVAPGDPWTFTAATQQVQRALRRSGLFLGEAQPG